MHTDAVTLELNSLLKRLDEMQEDFARMAREQSEIVEQVKRGNARMRAIHEPRREADGKCDSFSNRDDGRASTGNHASRAIWN